jgi:hypothetical protein
MDTSSWEITGFPDGAWLRLDARRSSNLNIAISQPGEA